LSRSTTVHDLRALVRSFHPLIVLDTLEEDRARDLLRAASGDLGMPLFEWSVTRGLRREGEERATLGTADPVGMLRHLQGLTVEGLFWIHDLERFLGDPGAARELREVLARFSRTRSTILLARSGELPPDVEAQAAYLRLEPPSRDELRAVVRAVIESLRRRERVRIELSPEEVERLLDAIRGMTANQARQAVAYAALRDGRLTGDDIPLIQERKARFLREAGPLEYFPAEDNPYELGGFDRLKRWLERAAMGFSREARELGLPAPRGILLVGVQGCGKSLAARSIARAWKLPLLRLDAARLYDKYIGESEKNLLRAIEVAEAMAPAVLWIDEIEKGFGFSTSSESDGGVSRRLFGSLLTWMQDKPAPVFLVATANDVFSLPPELLRKGRFDEIFFVDLPDAQDREAIFRIHLSRHKQDPGSLALERLTAATEGFSGAEIEQVVIAGLYRALHERRPLSTELLLAEIEGTVPLSLTRREDVSRLRELARERFVPVK
jgi:MoxR-like ATPase